MIRRSLFLQIYALIITSLAIAAVIMVTLAGLGRFDQRDPVRSQFGQAVGFLLSPNDNPRSVQLAVNRMARAFNANISVYDSHARLIAHFGRPLPYATKAGEPSGFGSGPRTYVVDTPQNMRVIVKGHGTFRNPRRNIALVTILIAIAVGAAAYPATRYLTRRLTALNQGMETWSKGALETRVTVDGNDEIADAARTFNKAAQRIEELVNAQKSLLANASHELRSPLARLRMATEMFEQSPSDKLRGEIIKNLAELDELVEEILIMSRLESHQSETFEDRVDLLPLLAEEGAIVSAVISGEDAAVSGNAKLLRRLMRNLFQNAARHGKPPIEASVTRTNGKIVVNVHDNGDGIAEADRARIFEPFYRPAGRSESAGGWGLGLALVKQIAEAHGATARYAGCEDGGASFVIEFPATRMAA